MNKVEPVLKEHKHCSTCGKVIVNIFSSSAICGNDAWEIDMCLECGIIIVDRYLYRTAQYAYKNKLFKLD